jgi:hypothetical protein
VTVERLKKAAAQRAIDSINAGHVPEFIQKPRSKYPDKLGVAWRCSCGQEGQGRPTKQSAVVAFLWHLEEISAARSEKASPKAS